MQVQPTIAEGYKFLTPYDAWLKRIQERFALHANSPLFSIGINNLFNSYLLAFPAEERQHYTCHACKHFIEHYGRLVVVTPDGELVSALWSEHDTTDPVLQKVAKTLRLAVEGGRIKEVRSGPAGELGKSRTGDWTHFSVMFDPVFKLPQPPHEIEQSVVMTKRALSEYGPNVLTVGLQYANTANIYGSSMLAAPIRWLLELQKTVADANRSAKDNIIWMRVVGAPISHSRIRGTVTGEFLDDVKAGKSYETIVANHNAKVAPDKYQRPTTAPDEQNIKQAEELVAKLGVANSLKRRFARIEEVPLLWQPAGKPSGDALESGGVFDHLKAEKEIRADMSQVPAETMTWVKFRDYILPDAEKLELLVPNGIGNFIGVLTAVDPEAPLIFKWDSPLSWYTYHHGSHASQWRLAANQFANVTGIFDPGQLDKSRGNQQPIFLLAGAVDSKDSGLALFPATLKGEFHGIRKTIEAFSKAGKLEGREQASACGIAGLTDSNWCLTLRVNDGLRYNLDRFD